MYLTTISGLAQPTRTVTSAELEAERAEVEKERARFQAARAQHEARLARRPVHLLPVDVLKRAGLRSTTQVGNKTASLIQDALERSRVLRPYIERQLRSVLIPKGFVIHSSDEEFNRAFIRLHNISGPWGLPQQRDLETKRGFFHPPTSTIHLRPAADLGHALHEAIHKFAGRVFRFVFGGFLDEGVTQHFTDAVLVEQGLGRMTTHQYALELRCAQHLVALFTPDLVARAYFQGGDSLNQLALEVANRLGITVPQLQGLRQGDALCQRLHRLRP